MFKRGEQFVLRSWGMVLKTGEVLSNDNVKEAHFSIAGQPDIVLNWGAHGATGAKVFFWTNAWNIPRDVPARRRRQCMSSTRSRAASSGAYDYDINIIP